MQVAECGLQFNVFWYLNKQGAKQNFERRVTICLKDKFLINIQ